MKLNNFMIKLKQQLYHYYTREIGSVLDGN